MINAPHGAHLAILTICLVQVGLAALSSAAEAVNYEEDKVPAYTLPDPLVCNDGKTVISATMWTEQRRPEILAIFESQVYGRALPAPVSLKFKVTDDTPAALEGKAIRKRVRIGLAGQQDSWPGIVLTLILPRDVAQPVPVFVGMHLFDSTVDEPVPGRPLGIDVGEALPGARLLEIILARGYAVGTLDAKDFCADDAGQFRRGVLNHYFPDRSGPPGPEEPGAISTWAWGLSRALDYLETDPAIDAKRVAVIGHSRMGKTALWAGAQDQRFALVVSNDSGCGGAALSRRQFGETVARITNRFPHWFCGNFSKYANHEDQLSVDQHELVALSAPRPVYVASAQEDLWADPRGEFLAALGAESVYHLLGKQGLETAEMPRAGQSIGQSIGYHIRAGKHALTDYDWLRYLDFADRHFAKRATAPGP